jgi:hypothetical protein
MSELNCLVKSSKKECLYLKTFEHILILEHRSNLLAVKQGVPVPLIQKHCSESPRILVSYVSNVHHYTGF